MKEIYKWFKRNMIVLYIGIAVLTIAVIVVAITLKEKYDINQIRVFYSDFKMRVEEFENTVAALENKYMIFIVLMMLFAFKSFVPMYPLSALYIISGIVYRPIIAILINLMGVYLLITIKYFYGRHNGGGNMERIVSRSEKLQNVVEDEKNVWLLFVFRLVPGLPMNSVSQMYGSLDYKYLDFCIISLAGVLPKVVIYSILGNSVLHPFSLQFIISISALVLFSISSAWGVRKIFKYIEKRKNFSDEVD